jgi:hypothetical protein
MGRSRNRAGARRLVSVPVHPKSSPHADGALSAYRGRALWRGWLGVVSVAAMVSCREQPAPDAATVGNQRPVEEAARGDSVAALTPSTYDRRLGALLLVPLLDDATGTLASVLSPLQPLELPLSDTTAIAERVGDGVVQLYARHGVVAERVLSEVGLSSSAGCAMWPVARLVQRGGDSATSVPRGWLVGLPAGVAQPVALDSIESLPVRDSALLAAALARLASALPEDSNSAFRGLPFRVTQTYRTRSLTEPFVLNELVRRVPQEDRPLEERRFVLVSTPTSDPRGWSIAWHERVAGREEEVIASEPVAVVQLPASGVVSVYIRRDDGTGTALALLQRVNGRWRVRWESQVAEC